MIEVFEVFVIDMLFLLNGVVDNDIGLNFI